MKKDATRNTAKEKLEILESDDEFPDSYNEIAESPAYEDNHRFDRYKSTEFMWLHKQLEDLNRTDTPSDFSNLMDVPHLKSQLNQNQQIDQEEHSLNQQSEHLNGQDNELERPCTSDEMLQNVSRKELSITNINILKQNKGRPVEKKIRISKGILTKRDIFFIKSIEEFSTDSTILWFIDFLNSKEIKPLQKSCLVSDITKDDYISANVPLADFNKRYILKLVVT